MGRAHRRPLRRVFALISKRCFFIFNKIRKKGTGNDSHLMETKELDMLIIHMGMELKLRKTLCHFLVAQLQDLEPNVSRKH
jgi:hypothetical protein